LSDNPPSRNGTERLIPSTPLPLTPHSPRGAGLTSHYEKAQIDISYPYDTEVYCEPLARLSQSSYTESFKN